MRILIILLALVAFSIAQDDTQGSSGSAGGVPTTTTTAAPTTTTTAAPTPFGTCLGQATNFNECVKKTVSGSFQALLADKNNLKTLKEFEVSVKKCFDEPGVKGVCKFPAPQPGGRSRRGAQLPQPFQQCIDGAKQAFFSCFKTESGLTDAECTQLQSQAGQAGAGGPPAGGPGGPGGFEGVHDQFLGQPGDIKDIKTFLKEKICGGNDAAATKLWTCILPALKTALPTISKFLLAPCDAFASCAQSNPISADCKPRLIKAANASCICAPKAIAFAEQDPKCKAIAQAHSNPAQAGAAAPPHHEYFQFGNQVFDFCEHKDSTANKATVCQNLRDSLAKLAAA